MNYTSIFDILSHDTFGIIVIPSIAALAISVLVYSIQKFISAKIEQMHNVALEHIRASNLEVLALKNALLSASAAKETSCTVGVYGNQLETLPKLSSTLSNLTFSITRLISCSMPSIDDISTCDDAYRNFRNAYLENALYIPKTLCEKIDIIERDSTAILSNAKIIKIIQGEFSVSNHEGIQSLILAK